MTQKAVHAMTISFGSLNFTLPSLFPSITIGSSTFGSSEAHQ